MRRLRPLDEADRAAWAAYARTVATLPGVQHPPPPPPAPSPATPTAAPIVPPAHPARPGSLAVGAAPSGLDKASWQRLRTGRVAPARTLDLHGQTAQRAFHILHAFLHAAHADRLRCVEVITGRGSGHEGGVLRRELPFWLNGPSLRPLILAATHPSAANVGAVRVLLRRVREPVVAHRPHVR